MKNRWMIILIFFVIITSSLFIAFKSGDFRAFDEKNSIVLQASEFSPDMSAHNFSESGLKNNSYSIEISKKSFENLVGNQYHIIINRLSDNAHSVYFNDVLIGKNGDFQNGDSNLWNGLFRYPISPSLITEINTLRIDTVATYRSGLSTQSVYITGLDELYTSVGRIRFYGESINSMMIGFIVFSSLITLFFYLINGRVDKKYLYASIATLLTGIYYSDYLVYGYVGVPYFYYKKYIIASLFLGVGFYSHVIGSYFSNKLIRWFGNITFVVILMMVIFAPDMVVFKQLYTYGYFIVLINVLAWLWVSIKNIRKRFVAFIFSIGFFVIGIYGGITVLMDVFGGYFQFNSPVFYISVFSSIPLLLVYEAIHEKELLLVREKDLREKESINSMTDSLTSTWNQRYMSMIFNDRLGHYSLALIDIDDFKSVNDTYGHLAGDFIIVGIAKILSSSVSEGDLICRYGGDEFVVILKDKGMDESLIIFEALRKKIEAFQFEYEKETINVTISMGLVEETGSHSVEYVFNCADELLYKAKANGKNEISTRFEFSKP